jgi:hypothetical protein
MEDDKEWVKRESEELLTEQEEYHEYLKRRGEVPSIEEGNQGRNREADREAEVEVGAEKEDEEDEGIGEEEEEDGSEEEEDGELVGGTVGAIGPTEN